MRPGEEEGNSNRDCRALALAETGFDFLPEVTDAASNDPGNEGGESNNSQGGGQNNNDNNVEISPEQSSASSNNTPRGFTRSHWSRRSRRGRRAHNRHCRRHGSRRGFKQRECNLAAAICSMLAVVTLCTALAEPRWFRLIGGGCNFRTLGVGQFFSFGSFELLSNRESICKVSKSREYIYFPNTQNDCSTGFCFCINYLHNYTTCCYLYR